MKGGVYMNINDILTAVTTVGFPIVCCGAMMYYVKYTTDKHREEIETLNTQHKDEMKEVTNAVNNNTLALQKLCDKMG
jgi:hypothetical protein